MSENKETKKMKESLFYTPKHISKRVSAEEIQAADGFCEKYKGFLDKAKTEREAVKEIIAEAVKNGFSQYEKGGKYAPGDKIYVNNRGKAAMLAVIGKKGVSEGAKITASHIDSPRVDLKQNPLYEDSELALFKTHYYGGIKKYQWTAIPLALHGVFVKTDGSVVNIKLGENENEPKFAITDLLPHLGAEQGKRPLASGIKGEELNILIGSRPFDNSDEGDNIKLNILKILNEKYGVTESDFLSAELELVPAHKASDIGFDKSMIAAYGHDDRICAYTSLMAVLDAGTPDKTLIAVFADKEEVGSDGNTGLNSDFMKNFIWDLAKAEGLDGYEALSRSECLSADVNAAFDPTFPDVLEKKNASFLNKGIVVTKYTGARGKADTSDASAEYTGKIRALLEKNNIVWQTGELGKVDEGGGGTVAKYVANLDVDVIDVGVPVLSMHSPYEIVSKLDVYMAYKAFLAFNG
ncbi:MAG: aminopeptidase [Oscillospiraceae bacterium]|nr:aminopeptidase [Oscillospiraceae bacterium]